MSTQMRRMSPEDVPAVMELEPQLFGRGAWSQAIFTEEATRADRYYVVLTEADHLIGYAGLATGVEATVMTLGVAPGSRRQGHASRMLTALLDRARQSGAESVFLEVRSQDDGAQRLYRSFGFVPLGVRPGYYQPEGADALVMQLPLKPPRRGPGPVGAEAIEE